MERVGLPGIKAGTVIEPWRKGVAQEKITITGDVMAFRNHPEFSDRNADLGSRLVVDTNRGRIFLTDYGIVPYPGGSVHDENACYLPGS